jgi:putative N-acetylmannosamine-6-phosphate epimerase
VNDQAMIVRDDAKLLVAYTQSAVALRDAALAGSALVGKVSNADENAAAVAAQTELQRVRSLAEKARTACKAPVIDFGRRIDNAAKEFWKELEPELLRVATLIGDFQALEAMKLREAEKLRQAELNRIEKERAEALAKAKSHDEADAIQEHFAEKARLEAPAPEPVRAEGQIVRTDWEITVTNPFELAKYHPHCVKIEPRLSEIKQLLNEGITVKGITATKVTKSGVRVGPAPKVIDV